MAQWLRNLAALPKHPPVGFQNPYQIGLTTSYNSGSRGSNALGIHRHLHSNVHTHMHTYT